MIVPWIDASAFGNVGVTKESGRRPIGAHVDAEAFRPVRVAYVPAA